MAYKYSDMSQDQIEELLQPPRWAIVGTNRMKGPPQLTPVWYLYENGRIYIGIFVESAKYHNLRRDPHIGICIAGEIPDARAVMMYGTVELIHEDNALFDEIRWRLTRRYCDSDDEAQSFIESEGKGREGVIVVLAPDKVIAQDFN